MDVPTYHKVLIVTDAAINIAPTLEDKVDICQNAIDLAISLGVERPKVAILAAVETVTSKMPATIDAAALCKMAERGQITGGLLDGPLAFDNAISKEAAQIKGIESEVAGDPDILLAPDLEAGNILAKQLSFLANADSAGLVLGARVPIILTSRADSVRSRIASCAVAMLAAHARRAGRPRVTATGGEHGRLRRRAQRRLVEPEVLRLPPAGARVAAGSARPDRGHRHLAAILGEGRRRQVADELAARIGRARRRARRSTRWPRGCAPLRRRARAGRRPSRGPRRRALAGPTIVTPEVLEELRRAGPAGAAASAVQPRGIDAVAERLPGVPQVACFDTSFHRGQPAVAESCRCRARSARRRAALRLSRPVVRVHRLGAAAVAPKIAAAA